jgi:hypothetical protein
MKKIILVIALFLMSIAFEAAAQTGIWVPFTRGGRDYERNTVTGKERRLLTVAEYLN